jgi:hypothetical protein
MANVSPGTNQLYLASGAAVAPEFMDRTFLQTSVVTYDVSTHRLRPATIPDVAPLISGDAVAAEANARIAADTQLQVNIGTEASARIGFDNTLSGYIATNSTAITALQTDVNSTTGRILVTGAPAKNVTSSGTNGDVLTVDSTNSSGYSFKSSGLATEIANRTTADNGLASNIATNAAAIAAEIGNRVTAVGNEATTRATSDNTLGGYITALQTDVNSTTGRILVTGAPAKNVTSSGTNGDVLTVDSTNASGYSFKPPGGGGGNVLLSHDTFVYSGGSSFTCINTQVNSLTQSYAVTLLSHASTSASISNPIATRSLYTTSTSGSVPSFVLKPGYIARYVFHWEYKNWIRTTTIPTASYPVTWTIRGHSISAPAGWTQISLPPGNHDTDVTESGAPPGNQPGISNRLTMAGTEVYILDGRSASVPYPLDLDFFPTTYNGDGSVNMNMNIYYINYVVEVYSVIP